MHTKTIIIGAGTAGISAAVNLAKAGIEVLLLETKNHPGGRVYSFTDSITGETVDNGQHLLSGAYDNFLSVLNELGTDNLLKSAGPLKIHYADIKGRKYILDTSSYKGNAGVLAGLIKFNALSRRSKLQLIGFFLKIKANMISPGFLSCFELLKREKQSDELIRIFWEPLILAVMNGKPEDIAASLLIEVLKRAFFAGGRASELLLPVKDLSALFRPLEKWMHRYGGEIKYRANVSQILIESGKVIGVKLSSGEIFETDSLISTVPPHILTKLLPETAAIKQKLSAFKYSSIINIYYWLDKHIETPDFTALLGTESQWLFNRRNFVAVSEEIHRKYPGMINITISGANHLADKSSVTLMRECFEELKKCIPAFAKVNILHGRVIKDKFATVTLCSETESGRPEAESGIKGMYLAGDWTKTSLPATMESAALSGNTAAKYLKKQHI